MRPSPMMNLKLPSFSSSVWMVPLLLLVTWLGAYGAAGDTLWFDEVGSVYYAAGIPDEGPETLWDTIVAVINEDLQEETNPPGYYLALNVWISGVGPSSYAVRLLSTMCGVLAVALVYRLGRDMHSQAAGLAAAALLGTSAFYINYLHEARSYAQYALFTSLSLWAYWRLISDDHPRRWLYLALGVGIFGLLYTHFLSTVFIFVAALYHLFFVRKTARWWRVLATVFVACLLFVPWIPVMLNAFGQVDASQARAAFSLTVPQLVARLLAAFSNGNTALMLGLLALGVAVRRWMPWFLLLTAFAIYAAVNLVVNFLSDVHYLMALFPLLALLAGMGAAHLPLGRRALVGAWMAVGVFLVVRPPEPEDWRRFLPWDDLTEQVGPLIHIDDVVVFQLPSSDPFWIHRRVADYYLPELVSPVNLHESLTNVSDIDSMNQLRDYVDNADRFWMAYDREQPPRGQAMRNRARVLNDGYLLCGEDYLPEARVQLDLYAPEPNRLTEFDDGVQFGMMRWPPHLIEDRAIDLLIGTGVAAGTPPNTYSVSVQLVDVDENLLAQQDFPLSPDELACEHIMLDLPAEGGTYTILGTVYAWESGARLSYDGQTRPDHRLELARFDIP